MIRFLIVSPVIHKRSGNRYAGYTPYVREMNLWLKYVDEVRIVAPVSKQAPDALEAYYQHDKLRLTAVPFLDFRTLWTALASAFKIPVVLYQLIAAMIWANHIHLRCPSNIGLLALVVQIFFPGKVKTVKYANNWDPSSSQSYSYRLQQNILRKGRLTRNATVLVYGDWHEKNPNIVPFFTASYSRANAVDTEIREISKDAPLKLIFVGTLTSNKRPLDCVKSLQLLREKGYDASLNMFGDGDQRSVLQSYIDENQLSSYVHIWGKQSPDKVETFFNRAHFLVFLSMTEGWPKVVAEAMWWGCLPITTNVSCVSQMLGGDSRGLIVEPEAARVADAISQLVANPQLYKAKCSEAMTWSRLYDLENFEREIIKYIRS